MIIMLIKARPLAFASYKGISRRVSRRGVRVVATFAISRYKERGYETPNMSSMIIARRLVRSQRKGISERAGKNASKTRGMVSPTITQKATMPPNALRIISIQPFCDSVGSPHNNHCASEIATRPDFPKQCSTVAWNELAPLSFELMTISRIVQSTVMVRPMRRAVPVIKPALRKAYG